jgi:signal transduction histidine kinase
MADSCIVDLREGNRLRRVAAAHRDPARAADVLALGSPGTLKDREVGIYRVARTGEAELVRDVDDAWLRAAMREEAYRLVVASGTLPTSMVIVPLTRRAEVLGVLTLCSLSDARRFDDFDLTTAQAIADRAALAIENARLYEQTVRAKRLREDVLGIVSHDLRNPLNSIGLNAHMLAKKTGAREALAIERAVPRAEALINDLLTAAALDAGSLPLQKSAESLCEVLQEAVEMQLPCARERSVVLEATIAGEIPPVTMDRRRVLEAVGNLIDNALKFTPAGGRVTVEARPGEGAVAVAVSDTGPGIAADQLPHLFDRFWQGATRRKAGAGLGLSIAKGIAEAHGGRLHVDSPPGRGATFTLVLPLGA